MSIHALPTNQIRAIRRTGSSRCSSAWVTGSQNAAGSAASHCADIHRRESPPNDGSNRFRGIALRQAVAQGPDCGGLGIVHPTAMARGALRPDPGFESGDLGRAAPVAQCGDGGNPNAPPFAVQHVVRGMLAEGAHARTGHAQQIRTGARIGGTAQAPAGQAAHGGAVDRTANHFVPPLLLFRGPDLFLAAVATGEHAVQIKLG